MNIKQAIAGGGAVLLGATLPFVVAAATVGPTFDGEDFANISAEFTRDQTKTDELPTFLLSGDQALGDLVASSTRMIGAYEGVRYWTAVNKAQDICLVSLFSGADEFAAMSCTPSTDVLQHGLTLQADSVTADSVQAVLLPEGYEADPVGHTEVGDQLLVADASESHKAFTAEPEVDSSTLPDITVPSAPKLSAGS